MCKMSSNYCCWQLKDTELNELYTRHCVKRVKENTLIVGQVFVRREERWRQATAPQGGHVSHPCSTGVQQSRCRIADVRISGAQGQ